MNFLIVDDDKKILNKLKNKITKEYVNVSCDTFTYIPQFSELKNSYTVIIIDILLNDISGIHLAEQLKDVFPNSHYVFVSTHNDLIFKTQKLRPLCFIRKSHLDEDFLLMQTLLSEYKIRHKYITLKIAKDYRHEKGGYKKINTEEIIFVESNAHKLHIHTLSEELTLYMNLKDFFELVNDCNCFIKVHKTYIINMNYVYRIDDNIIHMLNIESKNSIPLGRRHKKNFISVYEEFILL